MATPTPEELAKLPPTDAANAAKYETPLPPNDPASLDAARKDPNYIGPTNFGNIQKQYTPYQIEQATTRNANGDIFWKSGVNIADIPASAPAAPFKAPVVAPTPSTANLPTGASSADANVTKTGSPMDAFATAQSAASETYLKGIQGTIDSLLAKQQAMQTAAKDAATAEVGGLKNKLMSIVNGGGQAQAALDASRSMFKVEESIKTLTEIQGKIADASAALDQGILYEESRPVRMQLLTGRSAELKKQGIASIGALQSVAEVVKGNIDLAHAYASDTIAAIKQDNAEKTDALNTLLNLANDNLIQLSKDEKDTIDRRMGLLDDESKRLDGQKDQLMDLATKYPSAFTTGGVTFTDSPESALAKMLPTMSAQEKQQYDLDVQQKQADLAKTNAAAKKAAGGSGSGSTGSSTIQAIASDIDLLKNATNPATNKPFTEQEIRDQLYQEYGGKLKTTELNSAIDNILQGAPKDQTPQQQQADRVLAVQQDNEAKGILTLDAASGEYTDSSNAPDIKKAASQGLISWNGTNWVAKDGTVATDPASITLKTHWFSPDTVEIK